MRPPIPRGVVDESRLQFIYMFECSPTGRHLDEDRNLLAGVTEDSLIAETRRRDKTVEDCFTALRALAWNRNEPAYRRCLAELLEDDFADVRHLAFLGLYWDVKAGLWPQVHNGDETLRDRILRCCRRPATPYERFVGLRTRIADGDGAAAAELETLVPDDLCSGRELGWGGELAARRGVRRIQELRDAAAGRATHARRPT